MNHPHHRKLRILCLHGYHGSAHTLSSQLGPLLPALQPYADFVFMDAPSLSTGDFGWWHAKENYLTGKIEYKGWEKTKEGVVEYFQRDGPFDGVWGFSQGSTLAGLLPGLRSPSSTQIPYSHPIHFRFAICIGGFPARDAELAKLYNHTEGYTIPSVHIFGTSDGVVSAESSKQLMKKFQPEGRVAFEHGGWHVIPREAADTLAKFLRERQGEVA